jgi:lipid-A-disaccharide synthase
MLSIFPFERSWYAQRVPRLPVEFVGHPLVDRYASVSRRPPENRRHAAPPLVVLLPGSREAELRRHLPVLARVATQLAAVHPLRFRMILPSERLVAQAKTHLPLRPEVQVWAGRLAETLAEAELAIAKSGTITLECAYYGVPTVVFYKTSWPTYLVSRLGVTVKHLAMPNLLAGERIFPELIQGAATAENIAREAQDLLTNSTRRTLVKAKLAAVVQSLGPPGATQRAARAIRSLLEQQAARTS